MSKTEIEGVEQRRKGRKVAEAVLAGLASGQIEPVFTMRDLGKRHLAAIPADALPAALAILVERGDLEQHTVKTGGRKRTEYRLARASVASPDADPSDAIDAADEHDSLLLALHTAESRLRHQAADYERRIADLTRQAAAAEQRARDAREQADKVLVGAMLGAHQAARILAEHGIGGES